MFRTRQPATVAIIGKGARVPSLSGVERWLCNNAFAYHEDGIGFWHWDRWFDVHTQGHIEKHRPDAWAWYRMQGAERPIYLLQQHEDVPGSVAYPMRAIQQEFAWGGSPEEYFTSSVDWMIALAISEGFERIELHGVDMWEGHERKVQREGAHYWIGMARGRGIDVVIPDASSLCKTERLYGSFALTSPRNFASMSLRRFLLQCRDAEAMTQEAYVAPGIDESPTPQRHTA